LLPSCSNKGREAERRKKKNKKEKKKRGKERKDWLSYSFNPLLLLRILLIVLGITAAAWCRGTIRKKQRKKKGEGRGALPQLTIYFLPLYTSYFALV